MGEGVAMRHTCNRRVEDAEEVGPPRGGPPGWRGVRPLSPAPDGLRAGVRGACGRASAHRFRREEVVDDGLEAPAHGGVELPPSSPIG